MTADSRPRRPIAVILVRETRFPGGASLCDAGQEINAIANSDARSESEYADFIGRWRIAGYAGWYDAAIEMVKRSDRAKRCEIPPRQDARSPRPAQPGTSGACGLVPLQMIPPRSPIVIPP